MLTPDAIRAALANIAGSPYKEDQDMILDNVREFLEKTCNGDETAVQILTAIAEAA